MRFPPLHVPLLILLAALLSPLQAAETNAGEALRSPVNQVFQFSYRGVCTGWPNGAKSESAVYLWIPEECRKVRGLVIMASNVPEHMLVGHPAIRQACARNDLALVWAVPSFWRFSADAKGQEQVQMKFMEDLFAELAGISGYDEIASVPWLPMGESGHLLMVVGALDHRTERCIAGICIKNPQYPKDRSVPILWTLGTAQEWGQKKSDIRESWIGLRGWGRDATWPLSALVEPGSGHFYCTDRMAAYFGKYIDAASKARLSDDGSPKLKPVNLEAGFLAWLPCPGDTNPPVTPYAQSPAGDRNRLWFFTEELAREAQDFSRVDWKARTQMPQAEALENCTVEPFVFQDSISKVNVRTSSAFSLKGTLLSSIPQGFLGGGEMMATSPGTPDVNWICGPVAPMGGGRFKVALDRTWKGGACYLTAVKEGVPGIRYSVQPLAVNLVENTEGSSQKIIFDPIAPVPYGTPSVELKAHSDSGLPVEFYVESGPAIIRDGKLVLTKIPPRAKFPVSVTVVAWQWGSPVNPKVKTAQAVKQTFPIVKR